MHVLELLVMLTARALSLPRQPRATTPALRSARAPTGGSPSWGPHRQTLRPRARSHAWSQLLALVFLLSLCGCAEAGRRRNKRPEPPPPDSDGADPSLVGAAALDPAAPARATRRRGAGGGPPAPSPPLAAAPEDFVAGSHALGIPSAVPPPPQPPLPGENPQCALQRERIRDLFSCELAVDQLMGDHGRVCGALHSTYRGSDLHDAEQRIWDATHSIGCHLQNALDETRGLRRYLQRDRAGRNLPPALPFEESTMREAVPRGELPAGLLPSPHPDAVVPRCMPYHTPVWDALIWRFVQRVEPTGCSQEAHLLRNYPPYLITHSQPLEPTPQHVLPAVTGALSSLSLYPPAVATANLSGLLSQPLPSSPPSLDDCTGVCGAPVEVDAEGDGVSDDEHGAAGGYPDSEYEQDWGLDNPEDYDMQPPRAPPPPPGTASAAHAPTR